MATLLELLKANGATDADLDQMKPLLSNTKFASAIESEIAAKAEWERKAAEASGKLTEFESQANLAKAAQSDAEKREKELRDWWEQQASPAVEKIRLDAMREAQRAAAAEAKIRAAKEVYGYEIPDDTPTVNTTAAAGSSTSGMPTAGTTNTQATPRTDLPDLSKYVTTDLIQREAEMVGQAIAMTQDLAWEHQQLFGYEKPINFTELRSKAINERKPLREIWERDMNVAGRRAEIENKRKAEEAAAFQAKLEAARREGYESGLSQSASPMTRGADSGSSRFGVAFSTRDKNTGMPWEPANKAVREQERMQKVISSIAKQSA